MVALLYPAVKLLAYTFWCYLGLRNFRSSMNGVYSRSLLYGFLRLLMGLFFAVVIWLISTIVLSHIGHGLPQNILTYALVYLPVRWIEWSIMAALIVPDSFPLLRWISATSPRDRNWRLGGIVISCLADIPLIASLGGVIPTGRFLC
jgi:uncharacterized BrkB/YihY/UPF0761 family membrane protein